MAYAYVGKILMVDLSRREVEEREIPDKIYEKYLSGLGLGYYILYNEVPAGADPLGPDNVIGFVSGLLTSTRSLFTGRWMVVGKSPLTGGCGDANCGGNFSPALKKAGYDGVFFKGVSEKPVYLEINDGVAQLRDATHVWGKDTVETDKILTKEAAGRRPRVVCIGRAGEKMSLISGISNDKGRMAGRSGMGAVMGSKNLKAVVVTGTRKTIPYDKEEMKRLSRKCLVWVKFQPPFIPGSGTPYMGKALRMMPMQMTQIGFLYKMLLKKWGTVSMNQASLEMGDAPIKNWKGTHLDFGTDKSYTVNPDVFTECEVQKYYCYSCPLGCGGICKIKDPRSEYDETHKPEYETVIALGGLLMNEDSYSIFYLNELLNRAGMDTISCGSSIAFAIECFENGLLTEEDTGGLALEWGNTDAIIKLVKMMINREGLGDILADGSKHAADRIGKGSHKYAMHAGGQDLPMHDGRNDPGFALHYAVEPTPGRHTIGSQLYYEMFNLWKRVTGIPKMKMFFHKNEKYISAEDKAIKAAACSKFMNVVNGLGMCKFGTFLGVDKIPVFEWINAATGWNKTPNEYMRIGERIQTIRQAFNIKHGVDPKQNRPNDRTLGAPPQTQGANKGRSVDLNRMIKAYWEEFGWDERTGIPSVGTMYDIEVNEEEVL